MLRLFRVFAVAVLCLSAGYRGNAFSLLGPPAAWQTHQLGYDVSAPLGNYGPMGLGEEYRWNVPELYFGFTSDFLNYFGAKGADEIEAAIQILNDLPKASQINIDDYPVTSMRINHRAQALGLTDLKSFTLQIMLYQMGVCDSSRYVFCIRNRWTPGSCPPILYHVIQRNFDPDTLHYSSYINGDLWTYTTIIDTCTPPPDYAFLLPEPVDPMALLGFRHMPVSSVQAGFAYGGFWTTLTRDDVTALRYIYRGNNYNVEHIPTGVSGGTNFAGVGGSPWSLPPEFLTNISGTNISSTNGFVEPGLRGGVEHVTWKRVDFDSVLGGFFTPITNTYTENVIVNNRTVSQGVRRVIQVPDVLFDAADLQGGDANNVIVTDSMVISAWQNNDAINGIAGQFGPGNPVPSVGTAPGFILTFNSVGPIWGNQWPNVLSQADAIQPNQFLLWGSYDGSTNAPVVYPIGTSIEAIEAQVLGGGN